MMDATRENARNGHLVPVDVHLMRREKIRERLMISQPLPFRRCALRFGAQAPKAL
ncbi:MAG: hypothetical protein KAH44_03240 [Oricola sp.]|jgi:hypothetical protein|nr:hypothetical protein [Oricola sp.]